MPGSDYPHEGPGCSSTSSELIRGNDAFKRGSFRRAVELWSLALAADQAHLNPAVVLASRSAAYGHLGCWVQALSDAEQAVQLQPNSVRALYRLASAQYHLQRVRQCVDTCTSALVIRPGARQLHQLRHQAEDMLRATFLSTRHCEVSCATNQATLAAANKTMAELCSQQQSLQPQEDNNAAAKQRQQIDAFETEQFVNWANHNNHNCSDKGDHVSTSTGKRALSSEINTCHVMDLEQSTNLKELRCAYVRAIKKAHPDKGGSAEQFCRVQAAYDQISLGAAEPHN